MTLNVTMAVKALGPITASTALTTSSSSRTTPGQRHKQAFYKNISVKCRFLVKVKLTLTKVSFIILYFHKPASIVIHQSAFSNTIFHKPNELRALLVVIQWKKNCCIVCGWTVCTINLSCTQVKVKLKGSQ